MLGCPLIFYVNTLSWIGLIISVSVGACTIYYSNCYIKKNYYTDENQKKNKKNMCIYISRNLQFNNPLTTPSNTINTYSLSIYQNTQTRYIYKYMQSRNKQCAIRAITPLAVEQPQTLDLLSTATH